MKKQSKKRRYNREFELVPETAGKIVDSVWIKKDKTELIISFAWGGDLHFKPIKKYGKIK